jgi:serine/threonine protein phosphatase PrpC
MLYRLLSVGLSDIGLIRQNNEDVWAELPKKRFYVLADGMGGHQAGEVAAREAVEWLCQSIDKNTTLSSKSTSIQEAKDIITEAIEEVNTHIFRMGRQDPDLRGMGTTLCCLYFHPKAVIYAHVGDSRIYRLRGNELLQLTKDHSLLRELLDVGQINARQAGEFAYKNIITKAIGTEHQVQPSVRTTEIIGKDIYLMCTDGLSDHLKFEEIEAILAQRKALKVEARELVDSAKSKGGFDNITLVLVRVSVRNERKDE